MNQQEAIQYITDVFEGVETAENFGYVFFFFGDERMLPFATIASSDNEHDHASNLNRLGVYRLNMGVSKQTFETLFGAGKIDVSAYDFSALDTLMPHPDYAAQHYLCVLNPDATLEQVKILLKEAYELAVTRRTRRAQQKS